LLDSAAYRLLAIISSNGLWKAAGTGFFLTASAKPSELLYSFTEYSGTILYSVFSMSIWLAENQI
jgi:hypothetical protein